MRGVKTPLVTSWARVDGGFAGALKHGTKVVWKCGHVHRRRDWGSIGTESAADCAEAMLRQVEKPELLEDLRRRAAGPCVAGWVAPAEVERAEEREAAAVELRQRFGVGSTAA